MNPKNIGIIGTGYVGLVTGVIFAKWGHNVYCVDSDKKKIKQLRKGIPTIYEPGLKKLLQETIKRGNIKFCNEAKEMIDKVDYIFICVGTPSEERPWSNDPYFYKSNLVYFSKIAEELSDLINKGFYSKKELIIIDKSTVPVKTAEKLKLTLKNRLTKQVKINVVSNPEFLREGKAVEDCLYPDRVVIGSNDPETINKVKEIYLGHVPEEKILETNLWSAELGKLTSNAHLAMSISFANLISRFCDKTGADMKEVSEIMRRDKRIGPHAFLTQGLGFGGSCFPKDIKSLYSLFKESGLDSGLFYEILKINDEQINYFIEKIRDEVWILSEKKVGILGTAFKDDTDDVRESRSIKLIEELSKLNLKEIKVYDPQALDNTKTELNKLGIKNIKLIENLEKTYTDVDILIIATEWPEFKQIDPKRLKEKMTNGNLSRPSWIFEGRPNIFNPDKMKELGFHFYSIGRPSNN